MLVCQQKGVKANQKPKRPTSFGVNSVQNGSKSLGVGQNPTNKPSDEVDRSDFECFCIASIKIHHFTNTIFHVLVQI